MLAATAFVASVTAFQQSAPLFTRPRANQHASSSRRFAVTDPDILLREKVRLRSVDLDALEKAYMSSSDLQEPLFEEPLFEEPTVEESPKPARKRTKIKKKRSRSSTMPGFSQKTARQQAFEDGIKLMEQQSGKRFVETEAQKKSRRKQSSEQMYKTSASVPDSLVRFANEIHLVRNIYYSICDQV